MSIRQGITSPDEIHIVQDAQGEVYLATREGPLWRGLFGEMIMFARDLGKPRELVSKLSGLEHCCRLWSKESLQVGNLGQLTRELLGKEK